MPATSHHDLREEPPATLVCGNPQQIPLTILPSGQYDPAQVKLMDP